MNERLKQIRLDAGLTQEELSSKIGLSRNFIAQMETGKKKPSDRTIKDICRELNINEKWLRTGKGEIKAALDPDDRLSINLSKLGRSENEFIQNAVNTLAESDPDKLLIIEDFMRQCLGLKKEQD